MNLLRMERLVRGKHKPVSEGTSAQNLHTFKYRIYLDHVIRVALFGATDPDEQRPIFHRESSKNITEGALFLSSRRTNQAKAFQIQQPCIGHFTKRKAIARNKTIKVIVKACAVADFPEADLHIPVLIIKGESSRKKRVRRSGPVDIRGETNSQIGT